MLSIIIDIAAKNFSSLNHPVKIIKKQIRKNLKLILKLILYIKYVDKTKMNEPKNSVKPLPINHLKLSPKIIIGKIKDKENEI